MKKVLMAFGTLLLMASPSFAQTTEEDFEQDAILSETAPTPEEDPAMQGEDKARYFICAARNLRGQVFRAWGPNLQNVRWRAMNYCRSRSAVCHFVGCRVAYR